jgi:hypothetical protein
VKCTEVEAFVRSPATERKLGDDGDDCDENRWTRGEVDRELCTAKTTALMMVHTDKESIAPSFR